MSKFRYYGPAEILHINARKEGPDDEKELAVDVKLKCSIESDALRYFDEMLAELLYLDSGAVRNIMMGPITFLHEIEHYRLDAFGLMFTDVKVKKFSIEPKDGRRASLTFQISFKPSGNEVAELAEYLQDDVDIVLEPATNELDLGGQAA